jgi:hypothetical protein
MYFLTFELFILAVGEKSTTIWSMGAVEMKPLFLICRTRLRFQEIGGYPLLNFNHHDTAPNTYFLDGAEQ